MEWNHAHRARPNRRSCGSRIHGHYALLNIDELDLSTSLTDGLGGRYEGVRYCYPFVARLAPQRQVCEAERVGAAVYSYAGTRFAIGGDLAFEVADFRSSHK